MTTQPYILVSAHHCAPGMGSEHAVGWNLVSHLARQYALLLVTEDNRFRPAVEQAVASLRDQGCVIEAFFVHHGSVSDGRKNTLRLGYYLTYIAYQRRVLNLARNLQTRYPIGAIHHLTIVGFREPGFLWQLGIPFIWGPVGGLVYTPRVLYRLLSPRMRLFQEIRNQITWLQFRLSPRVRMAYRATQRNGGAFIAATPDIGERFRRHFGGNSRWLPETGSHPPAQTVPVARSGGGPLQLLWVGGLLDIKPLGLLLAAIADVPMHNSRIALKVVGDGDARARHEATARQLGLQAVFLGWITHAQALQQFDAADLFVLLSVKDLTTNVVFESLARGVPVLCLDHHGYASIVDETCGMKLRVRSVDLVRQELTARLDWLAANRSALLPLAEGALRRAAQFTWERNAGVLRSVYENAIQTTSVSHPAAPHCRANSSDQ